MNKKFTILTLLLLITLSACNGMASGTPTFQSDPNFTIVVNTDTGFTKFSKKVVVFGIDIYAESTVTDDKLLHAANVLAQYLDNNEDGTVDNQSVVNKMKENKAFLYLWKTDASVLSNPPSGRVGQDLGAGETVPAWHTNGHTGKFDAAIEEIWHLVTEAGYKTTYPTIFGTTNNSSKTSRSKIAQLMDTARGGYFATIPNPYPNGAWYKYTDTTCDYSCQVSEYMYWTMSSILGAQANRLSDIQGEWTLNTSAKVQATDGTTYNLLTNVTNATYKFPTKLPDGTYKR